VSIYAVSKKANELMAHAYSHLFGLPTTGLRFFTIYGPWGRPDMAATPDPGFDSTRPDPARSNAPYRVFNIFNIGNSDPVRLMSYIEALEHALGKTARKNLMPLQDGGVPATFADVSELADSTGFRPRTCVQDGVNRFVAWYRDYFNA